MLYIFISSLAIMKLALIIFLILIENQFIDSSFALMTKDLRGSKLFRKYSKQTPRLIDELRRQLNFPKEKSKGDVLKYFNAYIVNLEYNSCQAVPSLP